MSEDGVWDLGLAEFRDRTASDAPTPGGGAAAMVTGAMGVALVLMALRVSAKRPESTSALTPLIASGERLLDQLSDYADADIAVFDAYMAALKLPRDSDADKQARREALAQARIAATEVPLNAAQATLEALDLAHQAVHAAHEGIVSDVAAGAAVLHGALTAVLCSVDINLKGMQDATAAADYARSRDHLQRVAAERQAAVAAAFAERLR